MKILVLNQPFIPGFCRSQRWAARTRAMVMRPPDFLAYLTALLERDGHDVRLLDFEARGWGKERLRDLISRSRPDLTVLDTSTPSIYSDVDCASIIKVVADSVVVMVGPHATAFPEETLRLGRGNIDFVARGEYEGTVRELAAVLSEGGETARVAGLSFLKGGEPVHTPPRPFIRDLDTLPYPAWHHLDIFDYFDGIKLYPFMDIIGGRGCPFRCTFCLWPQVMHGRRARLRRPEKVAEEISFHLGKHPALRHGEFFFEDDTFTVDRGRAGRFCEIIRVEGLSVRWSVNVRPDILDPLLLKSMKRAGCRLLLAGFESGSRSILRKMGKGTDPETMRRFALLARGAGLKVHGCFILGFPGEGKREIEETLDFALNTPMETVQFSAPIPFPGTTFYRECLKRGWLREEEWWRISGEGYGEESILKPEIRAGMDLTGRIDKALLRFYLRPSYLMRFILSTSSLNDLYRKVRGGTNFFRYLAKRYLGGQQRDIRWGPPA